MEYDYIIVGAGSAGCALASGLSTDNRHTVLLLESGGSDDQLLIRMPRGIGQMNRPHDPRVWTYDVNRGEQPKKETWIKGHVLGGSSSINGMAYLRGFSSDYDGWEAAGCSGWGWNDMRRCFQRMEDHVLGAGATGERGVGGPLKVSVHPKGNPAAEAIIESAGQLGVPRREDVNDAATATAGGIGYQPLTTHRGERFNAVRAFLDPARGRFSLHVRSGVQVSRILFEGRKSTGVAVVTASGEQQIQARREVILCAGAIETPRLLQLSGIGPAEVLRGCGLEVIADAPEVGRNLREHRYLPIQYQIAKGSSNHQLRGIGLVRSLLAWMFFKRGVLTHGVWEATAFVKSTPDLPQPDGQVGVGLYSMRPGAGYASEKYVVHDEPGLAIGSYQLRPESRGELRIVSADRQTPPYIDPCYLSTDTDRRVAVALTRWIRNLMRQPPLARFAPREMSPGAQSCLTDDEIIDAYLSKGNTSYHVSGTCRMGGDRSAVVDPRLRVRGVDGLRVADTSIMPTMVSGNTNGPAIAIGVRAGELLLEDARA